MKGEKAGTAQEGGGKTDVVRIADAAECKVYVCFQGQLGAHLKPEVREKIVKGEYVEIFSLLPLEKFNLDRVKPDDSNGETAGNTMRESLGVPVALNTNAPVAVDLIPNPAVL